MESSIHGADKLKPESSPGLDSSRFIFSGLFHIKIGPAQHGDIKGYRPHLSSDIPENSFIASRQYSKASGRGTPVDFLSNDKRPAHKQWVDIVFPGEAMTEKFAQKAGQIRFQIVARTLDAVVRDDGFDKRYRVQMGWRLA